MAWEIFIHRAVRTLLKSSDVALISFQVLLSSWIQMQKNSSKEWSWVKNMGWKSWQFSLAVEKVDIKSVDHQVNWAEPKGICLVGQYTSTDCNSTDRLTAIYYQKPNFRFYDTAPCIIIHTHMSNLAYTHRHRSVMPGPADSLTSPLCSYAQFDQSCPVPQKDWPILTTNHPLLSCIFFVGSYGIPIPMHTSFLEYHLQHILVYSLL